MRKRIRLSLLVLVVLTGGCDWPQFRYSAHRSGSTPDTSISPAAVSSQSLTLAWTGETGPSSSSQVVAGGVVYANSDKLYAFDADGITNCSGNSCLPLWTANTGAPVRGSAVARGVVYVISDKLYAFDAAGITNCSGSPKTCGPLWSAALDGTVFTWPAVAKGVVYVGANSHLYAFDAAGTTNCSGSPKICSPLWTAVGDNFSSPAVANGAVYVGANNFLYVFDAAGTTNCSGSPKICNPLWTSHELSAAAFGTPAVADGVVYAGSTFGNFDPTGAVYAFDSAGTTNCSSGVCAPLCIAHTGSPIRDSLAVADGVMYAGSGYPAHTLFAFDVSGVGNGSCAELWMADEFLRSPSALAVANGVVYVATPGPLVLTAGSLKAFDTAGNLLWSRAASGASAPAVSNGFVYITELNRLDAFAVE